jgi:hypothetical protein
MPRTIHPPIHPSTHPPIHPNIHAIELVAKTTQMREPRNNEKQTYYSILYYKVLQTRLG